MRFLICFFACHSVISQLLLFIECMARYLLFYILVCCAVVSPLRSQPSGMDEFVHIGLTEGLSHSIVWDIAQDKFGYLWFATHNGLNRYDGYRFEVFRLDQGDSLRVGNNIIRTCFADSKGEIWVGTDDGLAYYNSEKGQFEYFSCREGDEERPVHGIAEMGENELLIYTLRKKLLVFNRETGLFHAPQGVLADILPSSVSSQGDWVYITTPEGIHVYSVTEKKIEFIPLKTSSRYRKFVCLRQHPDRFWVGTAGEGLFRYDMRTGQVTHYTHEKGRPGSLSSDFVRSLAFDSDGNLWIGTLNSVNIYDDKEERFHVYVDDAVKAGNGVPLSVRKVYKDVQGGMWLGTYQRGTLFNVSSTNLKQCELSFKSSRNIDTRFLRKAAICSYCTQ